MNEIINKSIKDHSKILDHINKDLINLASEIMIDAISNSKTIFWCGNGGSASQANHLSAELIGGMYKKKN